jgi:hypothetical protein
LTISLADFASVVVGALPPWFAGAGCVRRRAIAYTGAASKLEPGALSE